MVSSILSDLFELTVELVKCSKERIHGALTKLPKYMCKACYSTVKKYVEIRPRLKTIQNNLISLIPQDQVKDKVIQCTKHSDIPVALYYSTHIAQASDSMTHKTQNHAAD